MVCASSGLAPWPQDVISGVRGVVTTVLSNRLHGVTRHCIAQVIPSRQRQLCPSLSRRPGCRRRGCVEAAWRLRGETHDPMPGLPSTTLCGLLKARVGVSYACSISPLATNHVAFGWICLVPSAALKHGLTVRTNERPTCSSPTRAHEFMHHNSAPPRPKTCPVLISTGMAPCIPASSRHRDSSAPRLLREVKEAAARPLSANIDLHFRCHPCRHRLRRLTALVERYTQNHREIRQLLDP